MAAASPFGPLPTTTTSASGISTARAIFTGTIYGNFGTYGSDGNK
jgi:hypothetical protein